MIERAMAAMPRSTRTLNRGPTQTPGTWLLSAVCLFAAIASVSVAYGFQYRIEESQFLGWFGSFTLVAAIFLVGSVHFLVRDPVVVFPIRYARLLAVLLMLASSGLTMYFHDDFLPAPVPVLAAAFAGIAAVAWATGGGRAAVLAVLFLGFGLMAHLAINVPMDVTAANMLPVTEAACHRVGMGLSPYQTEYPGITSAPLYYPPALLLPYCPLAWAGLDLRILNVIMLAAIIAYVSWTYHFGRSPEVVSLCLMPILLSPLVAQMAVHGHVWVFWLVITWFAISTSRGDFTQAAIALGIMLALRQTAAFLAVPAAAWLYTRVGPRRLVGYAAVTLVVFGLFMSPSFWMTSDVLDRFYFGLSRVGVELHLVGGNPFDQVALSSFVLTFLPEVPIMALQASVLVAMTISAFLLGRKSDNRDVILCMLGIAFIVVISLNLWVHRYFYMPGLLLLAIGLASRLSGEVSAVRRLGSPAPVL